MRVVLKGIASATKKLASGRKVKYFYAWRGGPKLPGPPGSAEFVAAYNEAIAHKIKPPQGVIFTLIAEFRGSSEYKSLGKASKRSYDAYLRLIEDEWGDMPLSGLERREVRGDFKEWRDSMQDTPRKADYAWTVLARVLSVAKDRGRIAVNPCERGGRLYRSDRAEKIWGEAEIGMVMSVAPLHISQVVMLALWTGQRQGDLLRLSWSAYDGRAIRLRQSKTQAVVTIPAGAPLKAMLDAMPRVSTQILTTTRDNKPWTSDGFRSSWAKVVEFAKLGAADLTFHDLRGTAVTRLSIAGCTTQEIATLTGHSLKSVEMLQKHYLARSPELAESAILKLENSRFGGLKLTPKSLI